VYALLYHEGAPDLHATVDTDAHWSLESDRLSLNAISKWRSLIPHNRLPC